MRVIDAQCAWSWRLTITLHIKHECVGASAGWWSCRLQLADAIDDAFARWDRSHLQEFTLASQTRLRQPDPDWEIEGEITEDYQRVKLSRLRPREQFVYVFDLGDNWAHLCTAGAQWIDPIEELGIVPGKPLPYWGWGDIPDQYRRRWDGYDGESSQPRDPGLADLPPLRPQWGR